MDTAKSTGGTIGWLGVLLLPLTMPIYGLYAIGGMILRPCRPGERGAGFVIFVGLVAWVAFLSWLPDSADPWLLAGAVAFLVSISLLARRSVRRQMRP